MRAPPPRRAPGLRTQRLLALFVAGWALFDFPLLALGLGGGAQATLLGLPRLPLLLFVGWLALIVVLALLMERGEGGFGAERAGERDGGGDDD